MLQMKEYTNEPSFITERRNRNKNLNMQHELEERKTFNNKIDEALKMTKPKQKKVSKREKIRKYINMLTDTVWGSPKDTIKVIKHIKEDITQKKVV